VKTVNLNGHDILKCQEKHKPMSLASSLPLCYRRAAAKILREIILLTELAHDNIVKVRKALLVLLRRCSDASSRFLSARAPLDQGAASGSCQRWPLVTEEGGETGNSWPRLHGRTRGSVVVKAGSISDEVSF
jgi:hypothetical protein